ncbi:LysR family transcriptional regulator [Salinarimonas chemoclinalis]|uniref:LysR family transcriptional regulator n=1 Tax=Salinarimonas chemoclinalis TaxID=3241599 RepID=UPI00355727F7
MWLPPLNSLRSFEAAARVGSFTRAAEELRVTQAAVSQQVRALEDHLGYKVFERGLRTVVLTPRGAALATAIRRGFGEIAATLAAAERTPAADLRLTTTGAIAAEILLPRLDLLRIAPARLVVDGTDLVRDLDTGAHDAALRFGRGDYRRLEVVELARSFYLPVASPAYVVAMGMPAKGPDPLAGLAGHSLVDSGAAGDGCHPSWDDVAGADVVRRARERLQLGQQHLALRAVLNGRGIGLIERSLAALHLAEGRLVALPHEPIPGTHGYHLVTRTTDAKDERLAALLVWLEGTFAPPPGAAPQAAAGRARAGVQAGAETAASGKA